MVIFIDTSSLLKRYISEDGSSIIDQYFTEENDICISPVTEIEIRAALNRKFKDGDIDYETMQKAVQFWLTDLDDVMTVEFTESLVVNAIKLIDTHGIKTLDAIQVSSALISGSGEVITSDRQMFKIFQTFKDVKSTFI
jgi:uncharacterized protein